MTIQEWSLVVGVLTSVLLALGPWMFMVHAKLAVIATQVAQLSEKMEKAVEAHQELWVRYAEHEARLDTHDVRLCHLDDRLRDIE